MAIFIVTPFVLDDDSHWLLVLALVVPVPLVWFFLLLRHWRMPG